MDDRQTILIVDDSEMNRAILMAILGEEKYLFQEAKNGREAVEHLQRQMDIDLVLLDVNMPVMDGFGVLEMMGRACWLEEIPVIMISADEDPFSMERAYNLGATDYIRRPFDAKEVRRRVDNTLMLYAKQKRLSRLVAEQVYEKEKTSDLMISILSHVVEFRNNESGQHVMHIRTITELVLRHLVVKTDRFKLTENDISLICTASALHDIGKVSIPDEILNKPGKLTDRSSRS
ncbi:two-component system response regulator [Pseudoflavonifractor sp. MSJ-37]|uniref:response regulator n=1 Tax=Pseudoflavonifractor sp. MSJ-37 TaxID=2841531 RepID=UPI00352FF40A